LALLGPFINFFDPLKENINFEEETRKKIILIKIIEDEWVS
jgi:hypothetical protein